MEDPVKISVVQCEVIDDPVDASEHADDAVVELRLTRNSVDNTSDLDDPRHGIKTVRKHARGCENLLKNEGTSRVILNMLFIVVSLILYVADVATDLIMAFLHYKNGDYFYFGLTLFFSLTPSLVMSIISATWHWAEKYKNFDDQYNKNARDLFPPDSKCIFYFKTFLCGIFLLGPLPRYCETLYYGVQCIRFYAKAVQFPPFHGVKKTEASTKMGQCYARMLHEEADTAFLTLYEGFMESAPQLALQLYILSVKKFDVEGNIFFQEIIPVVSVVFSFISLSWTLTNYDRKLWFMKGNSEDWRARAEVFHSWITLILEESSLKTSLILFFANIFWIVSRFIPLISFASVWGWIIWPICLIHFIPVALWHWWKEYNLTYSLVFSFIHVFVYLHPLDILDMTSEFMISNHPRIAASVYYIVCFIENSILMGFWDYHFNCLEDGCLPWYYTAWIGHYLAFTFSIILFETFYDEIIRAFFCFFVHPRSPLYYRDH